VYSTVKWKSSKVEDGYLGALSRLNCYLEIYLVLALGKMQISYLLLQLDKLQIRLSSGGICILSSEEISDVAVTVPVVVLVRIAP
jgi:hypothetical protein